MSRTRTRLIVALQVVAVAGGAALTSACAAGFDSTTSKAYAPSDGLRGVSGSMEVLNALVVAPEDGDTGVISMTVVNRGDQTERITGLTTDSGTVELTGSDEIGPGEAVRFGAATDPAATISGLQALPGEAIRLKLSFAEVDPISLRTVVVPATGTYVSLTPPAEPTPTESPTPLETESAPTPDESASPSPTG
ncbi:MAG: hypothetical protein ACRDV1_04470 [Actinomycetes bacterium]